MFHRRSKRSIIREPQDNEDILFGVINVPVHGIYSIAVVTVVERTKIFKGDDFADSWNAGHLYVSDESFANETWLTIGRQCSETYVKRCHVSSRFCPILYSRG